MKNCGIYLTFDKLKEAPAEFQTTHSTADERPKDPKMLKLESLSYLVLLKWKDSGGEMMSFRLVDRVSGQWMKIGLRLGISMNLLESWEKQFGKDAERCWLKVMGCWIDEGGTNEYPVDWDGLCNLLEDVECPDVAKEFKTAVILASEST